MARTWEHEEPNVLFQDLISLRIQGQLFIPFDCLIGGNDRVRPAVSNNHLTASGDECRQVRLVCIVD